MSGICDALYKLMDIEKHTITAYRPQSNAVVERFNGTIKRMIKKYAALLGRSLRSLG